MQTESDLTGHLCLCPVKALLLVAHATTHRYSYPPKRDRLLLNTAGQAGSKAARSLFRSVGAGWLEFTQAEAAWTGTGRDGLHRP
jgi:hypothetical protein